MENLKNRLWIWGHPTNSLKGCCGLTADSDVSPMDAAREFGAAGVMYVPMGRTLDRAAINREMADADMIGWSIESKQDILDLIEQKATFANLKLGVFDDFFSPENATRNYTNYTVEELIDLRERMHAVGLEMWVVFYVMQIGDDSWKPYFDVFDGVTYWFWHEPTDEEFDEKCEWFFGQTVGKKRLIGCYLYDFGNERPATARSVRYQLDRHQQFMEQGKTEGIILHTNAVGGMGLEAYGEAVRWCAEHGAKG